jgi:hypothetical protein
MSYSQRSKLLKSLHQWKAKALVRRHENVALKKRMVELTQSRDAWKARAQRSEKAMAALQAEHRQLAQLAAPMKKTDAFPL